MKKHFLSIAVILLFIGILVFRYLGHGIPAVFFSDLGNTVYPVFSHLGDKNLLISYFRGWHETMSFPFYWANANLSFLGPLFFFFVNDVWLRIKLVQVLQIILAALFSYALSWRFFSNRKIAVLSSLIYATTPIFLSMLNGHNSLAWSYVLLPLIILLIEKTVTEKKMYLAVFTGIVISIATFISALQFIYFVGIPVFIYIAVRFGIQILKDTKNNFYFAKTGGRAAESESKEESTKIQKYGAQKLLALFCGAWLIQTRNIVIIGAATLMFAGFFLVPTFFEFQPYTWSNKEILERGSDFVTNFYTPTLMEAITLQNKEQLVSGEFGYRLNEIPGRFTWFYILASFFLFLGVVFIIFRKNTPSRLFGFWAFVAAGLASFILSLGKNTFFYDFLNYNLPYFWTIRTPGRFLIFYSLFASIFSVPALWFLVSWLISKFKKTVMIQIAKTVVFVLFIFIIFHNSMFFGQTLWTFKTTKNMTEHYPDLNIIQNKLAGLNWDDQYKVLDLTTKKDGNPHHLKAYSSGYRTLANTNDILWRFKDSENLARILGLLNIKYIITSHWPSWPEALKTPFPQLEKRMETDSDFKMSYASENGIKIWENKKALPRAYAATPVVVAGSPLSFDSLLDIMPEDINPALFFADQIIDEKILEKIIKESIFVFVDNNREEKPVYFNQIDVGWVFNNGFYLNPRNYGKNSQRVIALAEANNKPVIKYSEQESIVKVDLLANRFSDTKDIKIELMKNTANIAPEGKFGHRAEPGRFDEPAEIIYKITSREAGKLRIGIDTISLFRDNYVNLLKSSDGFSYVNVLKIKGDDVYPEFYDGKIWTDVAAGKNLFLKLELLANKQSSREIYDSRVESFMIDFIKDSSYNYGIGPRELPVIAGMSGVLEQEKGEPGKLQYRLKNFPIGYSAIVATETYSPEWLMSVGNQKIKSLPVNIFTNGFLGTFYGNDSATIKYSLGVARLMGALISLLVVLSVIVLFKKRL